ncbi:expressed unknown protein [Seminavis robusta]|uniref:Uncharacterized protein n=1 Tax=Seminavis robusta TaxID=568900 RepID=A0A9N8DWH9_9STRA|nr:expressed unknown protein [Seminavis robusta]|eukprot:Sro429_g140990.1 n/a (237) ;mRNA; f:10391-11101
MSPPQSLAQRVIQLNNEAIVCAIKGFRQDGVATLQRALAMVLTCEESNQVSVVRPSNEQQRDQMAYSVPLARDQCSKPFDDVFQFFNRAITLPQDDERFATLSCPHSRIRIQTTILYNLGVFCHMEAVCSGNSTLAFANALQFYGGAYQVLENSSKIFGFPHDDALLLVLALFNNMGHIHSSFMMDSDKTRQCISWMQSTFATPQTHNALAPEDYAFFSQYISVPAGAQLLISPAA